MDLDRTQYFLKRALKMAPYLLLYGIAFFAVGFFNFLTATYVTDFLNDALFWNRFLSQTLANILVFTGAMMQYLENKMDNEEFAELHKTVEQAALTDIASDFGEFVIEENKKIKMQTYQNKVQYQIAKAERKAKLEDVNLWYTKPKSGWTEEEKEELAERKQRNKYCRERQYLLDSISEERLSDTIMGMKVDYDAIDQMFIQSGYITLNKEKVRQKRDTHRRKLLENAHRIVYMAGSAAFFNGFIYDASIKNPVFWLQLIQSIFFLVYMFINGRAYAMGYIERILKVDLTTRFNIIKDYLSWRLKRKAHKEV